jgi:hypothetical protein
LKVTANTRLRAGIGLAEGDREGFQCKSLNGATMLDEHFHALSVFFSAFGAASFAGLATLLRFAKKLSKLAIVSAMLNAGFLGLAIALIWYQNYRNSENIYGLVGICVLAGMGGSTITDLLISILAGAGIRVTIVHERTCDDDKCDNTGDNSNDTSSSHPS